MPSLISIGNISVDIYFHGDSLTHTKERFNLAIGGKYFVEEMHLTVGGGAFNVAVGANKFGIKPYILSTIGNNHFKEIILDGFKKHNISRELIHYVDGFYNLSAILLNEKGEKTIIHHTTDQKNPHLKDHYKEIQKADGLYLGNFPAINIEAKIDLLERLHKEKSRPKVFLNLGVKEIRENNSYAKRLASLSDVIIINDYEFADLVKAKYKDIHFKEHVIDWYLPRLLNKVFIVTAGPKGAYGYHGHKTYFQKAVILDKIVDATGAGDAFTAGFIAEYLKTGSVTASMKLGSYYASRILQKIGAN